MKIRVVSSLLIVFFIFSCATVSKRRQPIQKSYSDVYDLSLGELETLLSEHLYPQHYEIKSSREPHYFETSWISGDHPFKPKDISKTSEATKHRLIFELFDVTKPDALKEGFSHPQMVSKKRLYFTESIVYLNLKYKPRYKKRAAMRQPFLQ